MPALALVAVVGCIRLTPWRQRLRSLGWVYQVPLLTLLNQLIKRADIEEAGRAVVKMLRWDWNHLTSWPVKPLKMPSQWLWHLVVQQMRPFHLPRSLTLAQCGLWRLKTSTISKSAYLTWQTWTFREICLPRPFTMSVVCQHETTFWRMGSFTGITCTENGGRELEAFADLTPGQKSSCHLKIQTCGRSIDHLERNLVLKRAVAKYQGESRPITGSCYGLWLTKKLPLKPFSDETWMATLLLFVLLVLENLVWKCCPCSSYDRWESAKEKVALLTDGRFSGGTYGLVIDISRWSQVGASTLTSIREVNP